MPNVKFPALMLAVALALGAGSTVSVAGEQPKPAVSRAAAKPLQAAQAAIQAKNWDEALAKLAEAEAMPKKNSYDDYVIAQFRGMVYANKQDYASAVKSFEAQLGSEYASADDRLRLLKILSQVHYQLKDYPKSASFGEQLIAAGNTEADTYTLVGQAYFLQDDHRKVTEFLGGYVNSVEAAGGKPREPTLQLVSESYGKIGDRAGQAAMLEKLVTHYPRPRYWRNVLVMMRDFSGGDRNSDLITLNIYRLMRETGALREGNDYLEMAELALKLGSPGEALEVIKRGSGAQAYQRDSEKSAAKDREATASKLEAEDRATLAKFEAEAKAAKAGEGDVRLGQALLSYGQTDKAVEAMQRGIGKGGLRNADEAQILLGLALLRLERKDEAIAAFKATPGKDAKFAQLARLWSIHAANEPLTDDAEG